MELSDVIRKRRSVRGYTGAPISEEELEQIIKAGLAAPSSRNRKPCELFVVRDKDTLQKLSAAKAHGANMLQSCDTAIVVAGDAEKSDTWIEDCSIVMAYMELTACSLGIGDCWCQFHLRKDADGTDAEENVKKILSLSDKYRVLGAIALGNTDDYPEPNDITEDDLKRVHR